jgi:hypothetical protein
MYECYDLSYVAKRWVAVVVGTVPTDVLELPLVPGPRSSCLLVFLLTLRKGGRVMA